MNVRDGLSRGGTGHPVGSLRLQEVASHSHDDDENDADFRDSLQGFWELAGRRRRVWCRVEGWDKVVECRPLVALKEGDLLARRDS